MTWADAMGLVVVEGIIIAALVLTGFRTAVFHAVPEQLKYAIGVGIGLFITIIGLVDAGIVRTGVPLVSFGIFGQLQGWPIFTFVFGLLLTAVLVAKRVRGAILIGILVTTALSILVEAVFEVGPKTGPDGAVANPVGWGLNVPGLPDQLDGDLMRLRQVLNNLLSNALKFTTVGEVLLQVSLVARQEGVAAGKDRV